jgi:hypothetical protein
MKQANTISLSRPVKTLAWSQAFASKEQRREFIRLMTQLEYQAQRQIRQRGHNDNDAKE